jgi:hypothetical protein
MSDPTRIDAGISKDDLHIEIIVNPTNKSISIKENVNDPILFQYLMGQALQTYSQRQMKIRAEMNSRRITVPQ